MGLKNLAKCSNRVAFVIPNNDPDAGVAAIVGKGTIHINFKVSFRGLQPTLWRRPLREGGGVFEVVATLYSASMFLPVPRFALSGNQTHHGELGFC